MKKAIFVILCVNALLLAGRYCQALVYAQDQPPICATMNGDVNVDGQIDISDAVSIIRHVILGDQLLPICDRKPLDETYPLCADNPDRFTNNGDETITDHCTGLTWQRRVFGAYDYREAPEYVQSLQIGGHDDWRLPTVQEWMTLLLSNNGSLQFANILRSDGHFWSSTLAPRTAGGHRQWAVLVDNTANGRFLFEQSGGSRLKVRAVRRQE